MASRQVLVVRCCLTGRDRLNRRATVLMPRVAGVICGPSDRPAHGPRVSRGERAVPQRGQPQPNEAAEGCPFRWQKS